MASVKLTTSDFSSFENPSHPLPGGAFQRRGNLTSSGKKIQPDEFIH
jgi:hypothetical protein